MAYEVEDAEVYVKKVMELLESRSDAERIEVLAEKLEFWYMSSKMWSNAFKEAKREEPI